MRVSHYFLTFLVLAVAAPLVLSLAPEQHGELKLALHSGLWKIYEGTLLLLL